VTASLSPTGAPPHLEAIFKGTSHTLEMLFQQAPRMGTVRHELSSKPLDADVHVLVGFTGGLNGQILLGFSRAAALAATSQLVMGEVSELDELARSALGEVANMVAGGCATELHARGIETNITVPTIIVGDRLQISWPHLMLQKSVLDMPFGPVTLVIGVKVQTPAP
jgi:chemotaxis protein CheX